MEQGERGFWGLPNCSEARGHRYSSRAKLRRLAEWGMIAFGRLDM